MLNRLGRRGDTVESGKRDIVCFANDWSGDPLSKKQVMTRLAKRGHRVLWVDSLGNRAPRASSKDARRVIAKLERFARGVQKVEENIWTVAPLALPFYGSEAAARVNALIVGATVRAAMAWLGMKHVLNYTFVPASAWVAGHLGEDKVVYHCVDEYASFEGAGKNIAALEERLLRRADLVITCSETLRVRKSRSNPRTILVRHGVDYDHFKTALDGDTQIPDDLRRLRGPVIGFYGLVEHWIDLELVRRVAQAYPEASVVVVGETKVPLAPIEGLGNVHVLGRKPYAQLPGYCKGFDVALLPFTIDDLTLHANPLKLREYLAAGLPVVSTDIPESRALEPHVRVARDGDEFVKMVGECLALPREGRRARSEAMVNETWDARVGDIERALEDL